MGMLVLLVKFNRVYKVLLFKWIIFVWYVFFLFECKVYDIFEKKMVILIIVEYKFKYEEKILF